MKGIHTPQDLERVQALAQDVPGARQAFREAYYESWLEKVGTEAAASRREQLFQSAVDTLLRHYLHPGGIRREGDALFGMSVDIPTFLANLVGRRRKKKRQEERDRRVLLHLQENRADALRTLYQAYWRHFIRHADQAFPGIGREAKEDFFQDTWIIIIEKYIRAGRIGVVEGGQVEGLSVKFPSFHYAICWKMMARHIRAKDRPAPEAEAEPEAVDTSQLSEAVKDLHLHEKKLVFYRFYLKLSYEEIREITDAASEGVLRTQLYRCLKKLRAGLAGHPNAPAPSKGSSRR